MNEQVNIWDALFEQTPLVLRYVLGVLTLGLFTIAGYIHQQNKENLKQMDIRHRASMQRMETQVHARMDRMEEQNEKREERFLLQFVEMNRNLMQIASNTQRGRHGTHD